LGRPEKIALLYASAGHGHAKAAKAILEAIHLLAPAARAEAINTLTLTPGIVGRLYEQIYYFQIRYLPYLWGAFYFAFDQPWLAPFTRWARRLVNGLGAGPLERFLINEQFDVIVATHFLSIEVACHLKKLGKIRPRIITVVTDYLPHRVWTGAGVDEYIVALPVTRQGLIDRGVSAEKIHILGIPIEEKFLRPQLRGRIMERLGVKEGLFTVLVTSGGVGVDSIRKVAEGILSSTVNPLKLLVVCGTNRRMFEDLQKFAANDPRLHPFGFVSNMEELMEVSDLVIGKAGGLTVTECLVKEKPMILFGSVPGQETRNAGCVHQNGAGLAVSSVQEAVAAVLRFLESPLDLQKMRENVGKMAKPQAARDIAERALHGR
jgi:processive 1,2-diacylglycerol beta-glucosyltransferase